MKHTFYAVRVFVADTGDFVGYHVDHYNTTLNIGSAKVYAQKASANKAIGYHYKGDGWRAKKYTGKLAAFEASEVEVE